MIFTSTGCYVGYFPAMTGTFGTAVGVIIFSLFFYTLSTFHYIISSLILILIGFWVSREAEIIFQEKDSQKIVIDEILGFLVSMFLIPPTWINIFIAFLFFRLFDTIKLFPANIIEKRVPGGYGVILDDITAGVYTNLIMHSIVSL
jgi:phosphatidylglycerophosphatase A